MSYVLVQGTASHLPLAANSVQCVVTSPPYWALRSYEGEQREVWGGDACHAHEWGEVLPPKPGPGNKPGDYSTSSLTNPKRQNEMQRAADSGCYCSCGAWYGALGLEPTPWLYVEHMVEVCREIWRVLRPDGVFWLNLGDSFYNGPDGGTNTGRGGRGARGVGHGDKNDQVAAHLAPRQRGNINRGVHKAAQSGKQATRIASDGPHAQPNRAPQPGIRPKSRLMMPHRVAIALAEDGWIVRMDNVWSKPNPMPDSTEDRTTPSHEYVFQLVKSEHAINWRHRDGRLVRWPDAEPTPEWRWQDRAGDGAETDREPGDWRTAELEDGRRRWLRVNRWAGMDYYYDKLAIQEPVSASTHARLSQRSLATQQGGPKQDAYDAGVPGQKHVNRRSSDIVKEMGGVNPKARVNAHGSGVKQNESFAAATRQIVTSRNARSVWPIATQPYPGAHFATFPEAIPQRCIMASSRPGDVVFDPFNGSGTTGAVALRLGRSYVGLDRSAEYLGTQALHRIDLLAGAAADLRTHGHGQGVFTL